MKKKILAVGLVALLASCSDMKIQNANASDFRAAQQAEYSRGSVTFIANGNIKAEVLKGGTQRTAFLRATAIEGYLTVRNMPRSLAFFSLDYLRMTDFFFEGGATQLTLETKGDTNKETNLKLKNPQVNAYLYLNTGYFDWTQTTFADTDVIRGYKADDYGKQWKLSNVIPADFFLAIPQLNEEVFDTYVTSAFSYKNAGDASRATLQIDYNKAVDIYTATKTAMWMTENGRDFRADNRSDVELNKKREIFREEIKAMLDEDFLFQVDFDFAPDGIKRIFASVVGAITPDANDYSKDESEIDTYELDASIELQATTSRSMPSTPSGYRE